MLGVLRSRVNEDDTPMDAGKGKSRDFGLSQALANQVVRKAVCGDFILCGLSPPVSPRRKMVSQYTLRTSRDAEICKGSSQAKSLHHILFRSSFRLANSRQIILY